MTYAFILRTLVDLYNGLLGFSSNVLLWLNTPVDPVIGTGTYGSVLFGGSIGLFLGIMVYKWVKELNPFS